MQRIKNNTLLLSFLFVVIRGFAQMPLNYNEFMSLVEKQHPLALKAANVKELGQLQLLSARGGYDPLVKADAEAKYFKSTNYYSVFKSEIKQPIFTSQSIKAGYEYGQGLYLDPQLATPSFGLPYVGIEMSVLQGLVIDKRRAEVLKGNFYKNYYSQEAKAQLNDLLLEAGFSYVNWLYQQRQLQLTSSFVSVAKVRFEGLAGLVALGERAGVDTVEAAILQQGRELDQQSVLTEVIKSENELRFYLSGVSNDNTSLKPLSSDSLAQVFEKAVRYYGALAARNYSANPQLQQYISKRGVLETDARLKREMIKPKLDVSYNFLNGSNTGDGLYFGTANYKYGVGLSFPLLLRTARNDYKMARLQVMNNEFDFQNKQVQVDTKGRYLYESAKVALSQVLVAKRAVAYSAQLLEAERLKFENGESSLFLLNTRENKLLESQLKLADYQLKFLKQVLQHVHLSGELNYKMD